MSNIVTDVSSPHHLAIANPDRKFHSEVQFLDEVVSTSLPQDIAVDCSDYHGIRSFLNYGKLTQFSSELSKRLQEHLKAHSPGHSIIPVVMPQHPALYLSYLAILKCGSAFCPITPDLPAERIRFMVEDVKAELILCLPDDTARLKDLLPLVKVLPIDWQSLPPKPHSTSLPYEVQGRKPSDIAYIMYTSGSTGKPKGVAISHEAVTQSLLAHDEHIPTFKRFLQFAAPTFDVSIFEIFFPWLRGATVVCCERERILSDLPHVINTLSVDAIELTPTVAKTLLRTRGEVPGLQLLLTIGEMLTTPVIAEFGGSDDRESILYAMYGPTEAAIHCTVLPRMKSTSSTHDIGVPLSTVTAFILEHDDITRKSRVIEVGQIGELAIAGQLASCYLNRDEQTAAAFVELPGYGRVYRTGDKAMMMSDGTLRIFGRLADRQVKIRGQRVELGEIEEAAIQTAGVDIAVALVLDEKIVLFCTGISSSLTTDVHERCRHWLPRHMRPADIVRLPNGIPRLSSGKIDRRKLEATYKTNHNNDKIIETEASSDTSSTEALICRIISEELHTEIDLYSDLWNCGLDSLRAIRIASKLRPLIPHISISNILEADSVIDINHILGNDKVSIQANAAPAKILEKDQSWQKFANEELDRVQRTEQLSHVQEVIPCSPIQIAMLSETNHRPGSYVNEIYVRLNANLPLRAVSDAFKKVAQANAILRAGFVSTSSPDMAFIQIIFESPSFDHTVSMLHPIQLIPQSDSVTVKFLIHHAVYDGWSWDLIMMDMNNVLRDEAIPMRPQYLDYSLQRQRDTSDIEEDLTEWTTHLKQAERSSFPTLRSKACPSKRSHHTSELQLTQEVLSSSAHTLRVSSAAVIHSALNLLLANLLDTKIVISGLVLAGRDPIVPEVESVIGPCLTTLPVLVKLDECLSPKDLLLSTYRQHKHALRHSRPSLSQIKTALNWLPEESMFDVIFVWQESPFSKFIDSDLAVTSESQDFLDYALIVEVEPKKGVLRLKTNYDCARITDEHALIIHKQLNHLINIMAHNYETSIKTVWQFADETLLSVYNHDYVSLKSEGLCSTIARTALENPNRLAIDFMVDFNPSNNSFVRESLTYQELHLQSLAVGGKLLHNFGLVQNDVVAIWCPKSINTYVLICGVIQVGLSYVCINSDTPENRAKEIVQQANSKILIANTTESIKLSESFNLPVISTTEVRNLEHGHVDHTVPSAMASGGDLAYAVFTSGSTGRPKGVLITRDNLMSNIQHLATIYPHDRKSRLLQSCSLAFDVSVFEIFWTWHCGVTLCSAENDVLFRDIECFISAAEITHLSMTPSVAALVNPENVPGVQFLVCSGEPMSVKVFEAWKHHGLHQGYGPSETTNICNVRSYDSEDAYIDNVGIPFPNTSLFVCSTVDEKSRALTTANFNLLPLGAVGEVWIGGEQVGRGYTDEQLTSRSWLIHPKFGKIYRSGDIGRLLSDGSLVILGRLDDQTKIRGLRIELNEISSKLIQSQIAKDAFTMIMTDSSDRSKLVSFWTYESHADSVSEMARKLFSYLKSNLPPYMIPEQLLPLASIPLTHQVKVDKQQLTKHYQSLTSDQLIQFSDQLSLDGAQEAMTTVETKVASLLSDLSGTALYEINTRGSFFAYGIDSIRAIAFAQRLNNSGFGPVDVSAVMRHSSVKRLLAYLEHQRKERHPNRSTHASAAVPKTIKDSIIRTFQAKGSIVDTILPCTALQESMLASAESGTAGAYTNHMKYLLVRSSHVIKCAWLKMIDRHDILRTVFTSTDDPEWPYVQIVLRSVDLPWIEHSGTANVVNMPPAINVLPYSLHLTGNQTKRCELDLFMHHALYDAEGLQNLHMEIEAICEGKQLPEAVQFSKYLDIMVNVETAHFNQFWDRTLMNVQPSRLLDRFNQVSPSTPAIRRFKHILPLPYSRLQSYASKNSVTTLALLQATLAQLLAINLDTFDVCFGTIFNGRNTDDYQVVSTVGPCFNNVPTRCRLQRRITTYDLCRNLQRFNVEVIPFQSTSLRKLQKYYSPDGRTLFDILLLLQMPTRKLNSQIWELLLESGEMDFPLILEAEPDLEQDELRLTLHTSGVEDSALGSNILTQFIELLDHAIGNLQSSMLDVRELHPAFLKRVDQAAKVGSVNGKTLSCHPQLNLEPKSRNSTAEVHVFEALVAMKKRFSTAINHEHSIFQLGLDSINAVQLAARLKAHGYVISMGEILERPRVSDIIQVCQRSASRKKVPTSSAFDVWAFDRRHRRSVSERFRLDDNDLYAVWPCTATQTGILSKFVKSDGHLYYNKMRLRLDKHMDLRSLRDAWRKTVERHKMLRTGFAEIEDKTSPFCMIVYSNTSRVVAKALDESNTTSSSDQPNISTPPWTLEFLETGDGNFMDLWLLHALYDAQSIQELLQDTAALYYGIALPPPPPIEPALATIMGNSQSQKLNIDFWSQFKSVAHPTMFPDLNIEYEIPSKFHVARSSIKMPIYDLEEKCAELGCSLSVVCQTAWAQLLVAYTGQLCVAFDIILSGRSFEDERLNRVAFPCIKTMPMIVNLDSKAVPLIHQVSKVNAELQKSSHVSYPEIKRLLDLNDSALDTVVVLQKLLDDNNLPQPWKLTEEIARSEYAVSLEIIPLNETLVLQLTYDQKSLPCAHSSILLRQFEKLLYGVLEAEVEQVVHNSMVFSQLPPKHPLIPSAEQCLHELILKTGLKMPQKIALEFITEIENHQIIKRTWTYKALIAKAAQVANFLVSKGVQSGDIVALCFEKCAEASFALLGILLAGAAYVAIDPEAPGSRKEFILSDAKCSIMLTSSILRAEFEDAEGFSVVCIDREDQLVEHSTEPPLLVRPPTGEDTCYCLYTSGTTGTPKGCLISHNSAVQAMLSFSRIFQGHWNGDSRWLQFAAYHFDVSVLEHFWSWSEGITVIVVPRDLLLEDLPGTIDKLSITHVDLTPSLARLLTPNSVPSLCNGVFIVGGEQVGQDIIRVWGDSGCLYNFYGPSEVTIGCTVHPRVRKNIKATNIGCQWENVGTCVLNPESEQPVMVGGVGELCLSGPLVGKGYLNRADLTAGKFVVLQGTAERVYRTGDLVRMLHDGSFEFLGRIDDQVKLRGQRLETSEINHILMQCTESFSDVATFVLKHPGQSKEQIVAFLAQSKARRANNQKPSSIKDENLFSQALQGRNGLVDRVPAYMVPTYFVVVDHLPLTINNKVDKKALKALFETISIQELREQYDSATSISNLPNAEYEMLLRLVAKYLAIDEALINRHTSLLQLGLDSVSVIGLSRTLKAAGYPLASVNLIMKYPIMIDLAPQLLEPARDTHRPSAAECEFMRAKTDSFAAKQRVFVEQKFSKSHCRVLEIFPCTPLQEGMISHLVASELNRPPYLAKFVFKLNTNVSLSRLAQAWDRLKRRLDILRTRFLSTPDGYAQVILEDTESSCKIDSGTSPVEETPLQTITRYFQNWTDASRGLGFVSPWEVWLTERQENQTKYMSLFMFHGIYDGISLPLLLKCLHQTYQNIEQVIHSGLQFHRVLTSGLLISDPKAAGFWRDNLQRIRLLGVKREEKSYTQVIKSVNRELVTGHVRKSCIDLAVTQQAIFQAAWLYVLSQIYDTNATIGIVLSGRSIDFEGADKVIGPLFNTLPFTVGNLEPGASLATLIKACHQKVIDVLPFQHTALRDIRKWVGVGTDNALFDSLFVFHGPVNEIDHVESLWDEVESESTIDYSLNIEIGEVAKDTYKISIITSSAFGVTALSQLIDKFCETLINIKNAGNVILPQSFSTAIGKDGDPLHHDNPVSEWGIQHNDTFQVPEATIIRDLLADIADAHPSAIGMHHPTIFQLGLDSVDALKLAARLKSRGMSIPVSSILKFPTVSGMLARLSLNIEPANSSIGSRTDREARKWYDLLKDCGGDLKNVEIVMPATPMQEALLANTETYFNTLAYQIDQNVDIDQFTDAIERTIRSTALLRTEFIMLDQPADGVSFLQVVRKSGNNSMKRPARSHLRNLQEVELRVQQIEFSASLDNGTPLVEVLELDNGTAYLILALSHAYYDAWCLNLLLSRLQRSYIGTDVSESDGHAIFEYESALYRRIANPEMRAFWEKHLHKVNSTLILPDTDVVEPMFKQGISQISVATVHNTCRRYGITVQSLGLTVWTLSLMHLTSQQDVSFGVVLSGRTSDETERLVFPTFNTIILRPEVDLSMNKNDLLRRIHELTVEIYEFQEFPLSQALQIARSNNCEPFNTLFTFQRMPPVADSYGTVLRELNIRGEQPSPPYALAVELEEIGSGLQWTIASQAGYLGPQGIAKVIDILNDILEFLVSAEDDIVFESISNLTSICTLPARKLSTSKDSDIANTTARAMFPDKDESWSEEEKKIRQALSQASGVHEAEISKSTSLFQLGLDSISVVKIVKLLREVNMRVPASVIIRGQTVAKIAKTAVSSMKHPSGSHDSLHFQTMSHDLVDVVEPLLQRERIPLGSIEGLLPATGGQTYMLDMWRASQGELFSVDFWFEVSHCSRPTFEKSFGQLVARVPALRAQFVERNGQYIQVIMKPHSAHKGPLHYQVYEQENDLIVAIRIHHALYDAVSLQMIVHELQNLCRNIPSKNVMPTNLGPFLDATQPAAESQSAQGFWTRYLGSHDFSQVVSKGSLTSHRNTLFVPNLMSLAILEKFARQQDIGLQALFFAVVARVHFASISQKVGTVTEKPKKPSRIAIGIYLANRSLDVEGIEALAWPTFNIVPLEVDVSTTVSLVQSARKIQVDLQEIAQAEHCGRSMREICEWTGVKLDCYINFLKLPEVDNQGLESEAGEGEPVKTIIRHAQKSAVEEAKRQGLKFSLSPFIHTDDLDPEKTAWCIPALDVEAKIGEHGQLAVGMFAPENMFERKDLHKMMSEVKQELEGIVQPT